VEKSVQVLITGDQELLPDYAKSGDAGADLRASEDGTIAPGARLLVPTGIKIALPDGFVALVHPRSGLAIKNGITVLNTPGTIDSGYRGEVKVALFNSSQEDFEFSRGDRIAQLVIQRYERADFMLVQTLPETERGEGGFGSSGRK
jgi:dUTP pyrophosphatase